MWIDYVEGKQTLTQLAQKHSCSHITIRERLDTIEIQKQSVTPRPTVVITDTTFWGQDYGVCVFRSHDLKWNIWWNEVKGERIARYIYGKEILENRGWKITGAVVDGRRGFLAVFKGIPVQQCQFHIGHPVSNWIWST